MVVGTATAGGGARGDGSREPHLRTQNVLLALYPMPLFVGSVVAAGIGSTKQILWERHNIYCPVWGEVMSSLAKPLRVLGKH